MGAKLYVGNLPYNVTEDQLKQHFAQHGSVLSVSQFTLLGDVRKGTRPSFTKAAHPDVAVPAWERFNAMVRDAGVPVETGVFGAHMDVSLVNDGPVTITLER